MISLPQAAYIHIPFCKHHCGYCDFAVVAGKDHLQTLYLEALELELTSLVNSQEIQTLFIGGGTPTYLSEPNLQRLMQMLGIWFKNYDEFSIEATPESITAEKIAILQGGGVNRISLGVQSFENHSLIELDRVHSVADIRPAIEMCNDHFPRVSLDLIFAVPEQRLEDWQRDLRAAVDFGVGHISTYGLTYEKGTPLWKRRERKEVVALDEDLEGQMYEYAMAELPRLGLEQYEISNFAKPGQECRHNQIYWANESYYGFGLGAARYLAGTRETNTRSLDNYLKKLFAGESPTQSSERLSDLDRARETIFTQLRRREGILRESFENQTGFSIDQLAGERLKPLLDNHLLIDDSVSIRLSRAGRCLADAVITELMAG
ncbi:radical SAM family heme chaperone HemW [Telmatocola sphagniphila]|uniref:Heme chaperone HemW n=1 Tax=Telmatocola sphagniphila TaxID=1123043 RepID=A0A8E6BA90_9BACT|nr:radical SAM family heme chaperone HemW [Telmatocola sphagniphila]QVL34247.1 radical SAM family heme chaperone HemW [Telmatocola sphagniphila]